MPCPYQTEGDTLADSPTLINKSETSPVSLNREQYNGRGFTKVLIKGGRSRDFVPVQGQAR